MSYRDELAALTARHQALATELGEKAREVAEAAALLEQARARARLPVLDDVRVAAPCKASWDAMVGDERVRHCGACDQRVYDLGEMTRDEAQALLRDREGRLCVRFFRRADGTILTKDCAVGVGQRRRMRVVAGAAAALAAVGIAGATRPAAVAHTTGVLAPVEPPPVACARPPTSTPPEHVMGEAVYVPPIEVKGEVAPTYEMGDVAAPLPR
jgi:hypothetical protein